jgi:hypothetical protein
MFSFRSLPNVLALGWTVLSLIWLVVACVVPVERDTWLFVDGFLLADLLLIALWAGFRAGADAPVQRAISVAVFGPVIWGILAVVLGYIAAGAFEGFPPLYFDFEASGEKTVSDYLSSDDGATLWIGRTLSQGFLLGAGVLGFAALGSAIQRLWLRFRPARPEA